MAFTKRDVKVSQNYTVTSEPIIKSAWLHGSVRASEILSATEAECQKILDETQKECELLVQQTISDAESQVWDKANRLLAHWESTYSELCDNVEQLASGLVLQALQSICVDFIPEERVKTLLAQLTRASTGDKPAKLFVHPSYKNIVLAELQNSDLKHWQIIISDDISPQEMALSSPDGEMTASLSIEHMRQHIDDKSTPRR